MNGIFSNAPAFALVCALVPLTVACESSDVAESQIETQAAAMGSSDERKAQKPNKTESKAVTTLKITDLSEGDGEEAVAGKTIVVHYTGWLYEPDKPDNKGAKFDSSVDRGTPFQFPLGAGRVIRGWDEGFAGMKVGGQRMLVIPPEMGYGDRGAGAVIPPNATLMFEVELLKVQ